MNTVAGTPDEPNRKDPGLPAKTTQSFGAITVEKSAELAAIAVAAAAKAEVEAAYVMALRKPRNEGDARAAIIVTCKNPTFAKKARYRKPTGKKFDEASQKWVDVYAIGPSIRFAEEAIRQWGNILVQQTNIYDDPHVRVVKVSVRDLECNSLYSSELTIEKKVERRNNTDRIVLGERTNTRGQKVYIVQATEDEVLQKQAALVSKQIRNSGLRLIPDHIVEDGMAAVVATTSAKIAQDPDTERKRLSDGFMDVGVRPSDLETYLRKPLAQASVDELVELSEILTSIKDGQASWSEYIRTEVRDEESERKEQQSDITRVQEGLSRQQDGQTTPVPAPPPTPPAVAKPEDKPKEVSDKTWTDFRLWAFDEAPDLLDEVKRDEQIQDLRKVKEGATRNRVIKAFEAKLKARQEKA